MKSKLVRSAMILSILPALFLLSGCTVIGLAVGSSADRAAMRKATGPAARILAVRLGQRLTVACVDGHQITGVYQGLEHRDASEYTSLYVAAHDSLSYLYETTLPAIGDTLLVTLQTGNVIEGRLAGFGLRHLWLTYSEKGLLTNASLYDITKITDRRGVVFNTLRQRDMMADDSMPSVVTVLVRQDSSDVHISTDLISLVHVHRTTHYGLVGFGIGLIADYVAFRLLRDYVKRTPIIRLE